MTFADVARAFARRYNWGPDKVAMLTPYQVAMYAPDLGRPASPFDLLGLGGGDGGHTDPHLPGKRLRTVPASEYRRNP